MAGAVRPENTRASLVLPRDVLAWLRAEAERRQQTASDVIRAALTFYRSVDPAIRDRLPGELREVGDTTDSRRG